MYRELKALSLEQGVHDMMIKEIRGLLVWDDLEVKIKELRRGERLLPNGSPDQDPQQD